MAFKVEGSEMKAYTYIRFLLSRIEELQTHNTTGRAIEEEDGGNVHGITDAP